MRIALAVHKFPPASLGGTEIYTRNLARALSQRHEVFVFYRHDGDGRAFREEWQDRDGFRAWRVGRSFDPQRTGPVALFLDTFFNPDVEKSFNRFLDEVRPDVVHFQHLMLLSHRLLAQAKQRDVPCVLTLHDYWFICANSQLIWPDAQVCRGKALGLNCARCAMFARLDLPLAQVLRPLVAPFIQLRDALVRQAAMKADRLIAPSRFLIEQYGAAGFPADRVAFLENGIDVARIRQYASCPSSDGRVRFTYLGSLAWQKGVHVLVEAFRDVPVERAMLRIYGDPRVFPDYVSRLREAANPANTSFEGTVPNEDVGRVLAETDVVVVPSLWYENSPVVIQEAFAAGVPVIASRIGALVEKVEYGRSGLLCAPGDVEALKRALHSFTDRSQQVASFRRHIPEPKDLQEHGEEMQRLYNMTVHGVSD
jgi:glycosyltransferase involved in cell wall biosynthesis